MDRANVVSRDEWLAARVDVDTLLGTYNYLDLTPLGRQKHVAEFRYHDKY